MRRANKWQKQYYISRFLKKRASFYQSFLNTKSYFRVINRYKSKTKDK